MAKRQEDLKQALNKPKQINEILNEQIETAMHEHNRSGQDLFLSAISAGLEIGFSVFLMASVYTLFQPIVPSFDITCFVGVCLSARIYICYYRKI